VIYSSLFTVDLVVSAALKKPAEISLSYSLNFDPYSSFPKVTVYDLIRKLMDNCYHGVLFGGLGSVLLSLSMYFSDTLVIVMTVLFNPCSFISVGSIGGSCRGYF
jgi:hypothetical protein